ncbi:hypothetical protein AB0P17_33290 [Streptomyces sp. NPDC088124]|uniref:hypothetical protein n=1 Tax=Streptomyces sp. NPDC088124 TaxID=3154654 RepID=UPI00342C8BBF
MTSPIEELLSRARLVSEPYRQEDLDAAEQRLLARVNGTPEDPALTPAERTTPGEQEAAQALQTLCETVVARTTLDSLSAFFAASLPEPHGARVLACILHLRDSGESARFWWQYAAGAGDAASAYCLHLHHQALGEAGEALWWHAQMRRIQTRPPATTPACPGSAVRTYVGADVPADVTAVLTKASMPDSSLLPTALRIINALKAEKKKLNGVVPDVPPAVGAVLDYVPAAVGYVDDDLDLPLPNADFPEQIRTLTTCTPKPPAQHRPGTDRLPARPSGPRTDTTARRHPKVQSACGR